MTPPSDREQEELRARHIAYAASLPSAATENIARRYEPEHQQGGCGDGLALLSLVDRIALVEAGRALPAPPVADEALVERLASLAHLAYEDAARQSGWQTQSASRVPWEDVPESNRRCTRASVRAILAAARPPAPSADTQRDAGSEDESAYSDNDVATVAQVVSLFCLTRTDQRPIRYATPLGDRDHPPRPSDAAPLAQRVWDELIGQRAVALKGQTAAAPPLSEGGRHE